MPDEEREAGKITRRATLRAAAGTVGVGGAALAGALLAAQASPAAAPSVPGQEIVGSWLNNGDDRGHGPKIATFNADGGWSNVHPDRDRTPAKGTWVRVGERTFHITRWSIKFDDQGHVTHRVKTRAESVVDPDGEGLTSRRITEYYDLAGKLVLVTPIVESRSIRIRPEPFP